MSKVTAFITDGTEEAECIIAVDLLRRAGIETELVSCSGSREVLTSHQLRITADKTFEEASFEDSDMLFIPGGKAGVEHFLAHQGLADALRQQAARGKYIAAVCAGPSVPGSLGLLAGRNVTCFPAAASFAAVAPAPISISSGCGPINRKRSNCSICGAGAAALNTSPVMLMPPYLPCAL